MILVGNPSQNLSLWNLCKKVIRGEGPDEPKAIVKSTNVSVEYPVLELSGLRKDQVTEGEFLLKNSGSEPLIINNITTSCGCTVPEWDKSPIASGEITKVKVMIKPEETGYFHKTVDVFCNTASGQIKLTIKGEVKK